MTLTKWRKTDLDAIREEFDSLLSLGNTYVPAAELEETYDDYILRVELPGIKRDDVNLEVTTKAVVVKAKRERRPKVISEFRFGNYHREIPLPGRIDRNNVTAEYFDGLLHVTLPKMEDEKTKVVTVKVT
jgi:HSP20 family protein